MNSTADSSRALPAQLVLAAGDLAVFVFFAAQGRAAHDLPLGASPLLTALIIAAPFAAPWYVIAGLAGAFRVIEPKRAWLRAAIAWPIAGSIGLLLRGAILQRPVPLAFALVALGINGALLLAWRLVFQRFVARRLERSRRVG
jgi:hypothetical protein